MTTSRFSESKPTGHMNPTVFLFAAARELAGADFLRLDLPAGATVADLRITISHDFPTLAPLLARSAVAVNQDFAEDSRVLTASDEVAIIPPVSGG
jgi:sulfur-carrier protein